MSRCLFTIVLVLTLWSCSTAPLATETSTNDQIKIDLMFTRDGCRMYRFYADGRAHYWASCNGSVTTDNSYWVSTGKGGYYVVRLDDVQTTGYTR